MNIDFFCMKKFSFWYNYNMLSSTDAILLLFQLWTYLCIQYIRLYDIALCVFL